MKLKRIKKLRVNSYTFDVVWDKSHNGGSVSYDNYVITIGVRGDHTGRTFEVICHELWEMVAIEVHVHYRRPDVDSDFIFMYDHRQHDLMSNMFASLVSQFIV